VRRREFITLLGGAAATPSLLWPLAVRAQQPAKLRTIGFLGASTASVTSRRTAAFIQRLRELGWIEGRTVAIEYRWAEGRPERFAELAAEFVRLHVDVIVTAAAAPTVAAKQATSIIPIVFAVAGDPVGTGLVASLARPGGNVTGLSVQAPDLASKRLGVLREVVPGLRRLAVMVNSGAAGSMLERREVQMVAGTLGFEVVPLEIKRAEDVAPAIATLKDRVEALYVCADPLVNNARKRIISEALGAHLPTIYGERENAEDGGLISYGADIADLYWRAAEHVDKILRGAKAGDIPVEQPIKFELIINLKTAKVLGIDVPPTLLATADEVIE
jgi:putative tryptophan/tyrosine transport system substrate-binding protein